MSGAKEGAELRLVTPGEAIGASSGARAGTGTLKQGDNIISTKLGYARDCLLYTSPSPRDATLSRMPSSA